ITACWTQLAQMPVDRASSGHGWDHPGEPPPPRPLLTIAPDGYTLERGGAVVEIPRARGGYDVERLARELRTARAPLPGGIGCSLRARDGVEYRELVRALDAIRSADFGDVDLDGV